jgi:uncharacterized membrane protein
MPTHTYNQVAGRRLNRIEALSDGVFAIAMTLLVLELKVPKGDAIKTESDLWHAFIHMKEELLAYFLSFMTLGIFWVGQSVQLQHIEKSDRNLVWINIFFLMIVSMLPFTTAFLSTHIGFKLAIGLYWLNIFLLGMIVYINWNYAMRNKYVVSPDIPLEGLDKAVRRRVIVAQSLYAIGALLCFINNYVSIFFIIAVQLNYAFAFFGKRK